MEDKNAAPRPVKPLPPRYARGWCPLCRWWLEAQFSKPPMPDKLVCRRCNAAPSCVAAGHYSLKGSHPATAVWEG